MHVEHEDDRLGEGARVSLLRARCPRLPDAHGRRARTRATSATPAAAPSPPGSCACRGPGATAARRWSRRRALAARLPRGGGRRGGDARDADARRRVRPPRAARSSSAAAAARTSARSRGSPRGTAGSASSGSTRTATSTRRRRRPSGQRVGDAAADAARPGHGRRRRRRPLGRAQPRPAGGGVHRRRPGSASDAGRAARARPTRVYVALDCDVARSGRARGLHARAGRADARRGRAAPRRRCARAASSSAPGFTGLAPDPANVEKVERLAAALGY